MNDMNMQSMMVCMIAGAVLGLVILVCVIVQTVLQGKILRELRRICAPAAMPPPRIK